MKLYRLDNQLRAVDGDHAVQLNGVTMDDIFTADDPAAWVRHKMSGAPRTAAPVESSGFQPPLQSQEVWAAGVTYYRSREARMDESKDAGASKFYDLVYEAPRPELFFKATAARARGHRQPVGVRADSVWSVPEPELTLAINRAGRVFGFTIGNDLSARDIEGDNPLYLPQAKVYRGSCSLGPCLLVADALPQGTAIRMSIERAGAPVFDGETSIDRIKRRFDELAGWLFKENEFPHGCLLMTGTGVVPPGRFSLTAGDIIRISIDGIGTLENEVSASA